MARITSIRSTVCAACGSSDRLVTTISGQLISHCYACGDSVVRHDRLVAAEAAVLPAGLRTGRRGSSISAGGSRPV